jgi:hypothetical protein
MLSVRHVEESLCHSPTPSLTDPLIPSFSLTHSLTHPVPPSLTHSPTHPPLISVGQAVSQPASTLPNRPNVYGFYRLYECCIVSYSQIIQRIISFYFLFTTMSWPAIVSTQPPSLWVPGVLSPWVKRPGHEANHLPPSSAEVKNTWSYTSTPLYVFMAWCLIKADTCLRHGT